MGFAMMKGIAKKRNKWFTYPTPTSSLIRSYVFFIKIIKFLNDWLTLFVSENKGTQKDQGRI